jgi:hypothetical protein
MDLFTTRAMTQALDERRAVRTWLAETFFPRVEVHTTYEVDIDVRRNKRRLAPFVNPLSEGKLVEHAGFNTMSIRPPYIKPKMVTTAADLQRRAMGVTVYGAAPSPAAIAARRLAEELAEMDGMIDRREEWMAARALFFGTITVTGEGLNAVIDFQRQSTHDITLVGTALWTDAASTPIANFRAWKSIVSLSSGLVPNVAVMGTDAANAFLANEDVRSTMNLLNNTTIAIGMDTAALAAQGVTYIGRVEGVDIFMYEEVYLDENGVEQPLVPADAVLLGSTAADARRHYGAIMDLDATVAARRFPKSWTQPDPSARYVMVQSAPLPVPHQIDAFLVARVVA